VSLFKNLLDALRDKQSPPIVLPDALTFSAIDQPALEAKLRLRERAEEFGSKDLPSKEQTPPDLIEGEILREITLHLRPIQQLYEDNQAAYASRLAALEPMTVASEVRGRIAGQKAHLGVAVANAENHMYSATKQLKDSELRYTSLKKQYGETLDPIGYDQPIWKRLFLVGLFIAFEGTFNAFGVQDYLVGGWQEALIVTLGMPLITVGVIAGLLGTGLRLSFRPNSYFKALIMPISIFGVMVATVLNLYIACFRVAGQGSLKQISAPSLDASDSLDLLPDVQGEALKLWLGIFKGDLPPFDMVAILMFVLAMIAFCVSYYKFFRLEHQHPDYVEAYRLWIRSVSNHQQKTSELKSQFSEMTVISKEFDGVYALLKAWAVDYKQIIDSQLRLYNKLLVYHQHCGETYEQLVRSYRQWNSASRKTPESIPHYFSGPISFPGLREVAPIESSQTARSFPDRLEKANSEIQAAQTEISAEVEKAARVIKSIPQLAVASD